jgi:hypothetical protein
VNGRRDRLPVPSTAMRAVRLAVLAGAFALVGVAPAVAQVVTTPPTQPPDTQPPATEPPVTSPPRTEPPATAPPTTAPSSAVTRPRTTVTRTRGTTTSSTSTTKPGPTTTLFVIPGEAGPTTTVGTTTIATIPQNDDVPTWSTNLFWVGVGGALAVMITTFVMTGRGQ